MSSIKALAKDTAIYGISSIVGKFLNFLLVPFFTRVLENTADYGIVTNLYAWTALLLVILTYGTETGFFRFANKEGYDVRSVYKTTFFTVFTTSVIFAVLCVVFQQPIANGLGYADHSNFIAMMAITVAMDAFASIPFAYLRYKNRPIVFASLKLLYVILNIAFSILFMVILKKHDVTYVFVSNILATTIQTLILIPFTLPKGGTYQLATLKDILIYSFPLLVLGVTGIMNQTLDRILFTFLYPGADAQAQLGIYGACFKVAMVMMMFTQAFRYAYEPFVFAKHKDRNSVEAYADAMKYYIIFSLMILLGVIFYLDIFKYIIPSSYWSGLKIVPVVLWTYVFQGIYFNLSFWYKLTDQTKWGAYFSLIGLGITVVLLLIFVPRFGYWACCGSSLVCFFVIMLISYFMERKRLHIPYDLKSIGAYISLTLGSLALYYAGDYILMQKLTDPWGTVAHYSLGTTLLLIYIALFYHYDLKALLKKE